MNNIVQVSQDDINFWTIQIIEHCSFLQNLINFQIVPNLYDEIIIIIPLNMIRFHVIRYMLFLVMF